MSGSLARLVLRAQARLPVAEPWRPSRYAAGSPEEIGAESIAQPSDRHEPSPKAIPRAPAAEPAEPQSAPFGGEREIVTEPSGPPVAKPVATTTIASALSAQTAPIGHEPPEQPPRRMPVTPEPARISPKPSDDATLPPRPAVVPTETAPVDPDRRPSPGVSPFLAREAALAAGRAAIETPRAAAPVSAPDVHISIGRLEVHAAPVARPAPARAPARHPALSLADYLARRR